LAEFIFMLTHHDATIPNALAAYESLRDSRLRHVGFKDIGRPPEVLAELTRRIHADGRTVYLEVVSVSAADELRSVTLARDLGVDVVMGGTHPDAALGVLDGSGLRYFPFPGQVMGHPSILVGSPEEIAGSAAALTARPGVDGLDLLAYRHAGDVREVIRATVAASHGPVVVAGSIDSAERIRSVTELRAWGFTIGGAVFEAALPAGPTVREQVDWAFSYAEACATEVTTRSQLHVP
jgi:hypothetical protein